MQIRTIRDTRGTKQEEPPIIEAGIEQRPMQYVQSAPAKVSETQRIMPGHSVASQGLAQMFGLDIRAAILAVLVDLMVFTGDIVSFGFLLPFALCVAAVLGVITYKIQTQWYGDDHNSALIKSMIVGLLTAIPAPLTPLIAIPSGALGVVKVLRRK